MKLLALLALILSSNLRAWTHMSSNTYGWKQSEVVFFVNSENCSLPDEELNAIIDTALEAWNKVPFSHLKLKRSPSPASDREIDFRSQTATQLPLIVCSNQLSDYGSIDPDSVLGFVPFFTEDDEGFVSYSGLVINSQIGSQAEISQINRGEAELVLGHEIGHVLGLGHSKDPQALMYFSLNKTFLLITQDDEDGIAHLYPQNLLNGVLGCSSIKKPLGGSSRGSFLTFLLVLIGVGSLCLYSERSNQ